MKTDNLLKETILNVLKDVHIETGRKDEFNKVINELESAIREKIISHEIDHYTEMEKTSEKSTNSQ